MKTERVDRRAKSNIAEPNLEKQAQLQMSARRLRSARKSDAALKEHYASGNSQAKTPTSPIRRDVDKARQIGAELSAKRIIQARQAKVDLRSEYCESGAS